MGILGYTGITIINATLMGIIRGYTGCYIINAISFILGYTGYTGLSVVFNKML
jgi:hypothetical protein